eukprot:scaffold2408_cov386-Prasinococcus_capsulatus_cf.AAC.3
MHTIRCVHPCVSAAGGASTHAGRKEEQKEKPARTNRAGGGGRRSRSSSSSVVVVVVGGGGGGGVLLRPAAPARRPLSRRASRIAGTAVATCRPASRRREQPGRRGHPSKRAGALGRERQSGEDARRGDGGCCVSAHKWREAELDRAQPGGLVPAARRVRAAHPRLRRRTLHRAGAVGKLLRLPARGPCPDAAMPGRSELSCVRLAVCGRGTAISPREVAPTAQDPGGVAAPERPCSFAAKSAASPCKTEGTDHARGAGEQAVGSLRPSGGA